MKTTKAHNTRYSGERMTPKTISFTAIQIEWLKQHGQQALRDLLDIAINQNEVKKGGE